MKRWLTLAVTMVMLVALAGCVAGLHQAARHGDVATLQKQLDAGADINETNIYGTPLLWASKYCQPEAVSFLVQQGADLEAHNDGLLTLNYRPLHSAAHDNCIAAVRILLDAGADINGKTTLPPSVRTPLVIAAWQGHDQITKYLISRGADIDEAITLSRKMPDSDKVTPILEEYRQQTVVEVARQAAQRQAEEKQARIRSADLIELLAIRPEKGLQIETLTQALIRAKNTQLPAFLVRSSVEERVKLLTTVELRIADAQAQISRLNALAEDAVRQGQSAAPLREEAGKVQTYSGILAAIRSLLLQS